MSTRNVYIYIIWILKWEFIIHWFKLTCTSLILKLQNYSCWLIQVLLQKGETCSWLPETLVCDQAIACPVSPDSEYSKPFLLFSSEGGRKGQFSM